MNEYSFIAVAPIGTKRYNSYLTDGKEYKAFNASGDCFEIVDDEGDVITCAFSECAFLPKGTSWEIKQI